MIIGERLRPLREQKNLSQGDIAKRTGLLRTYLSRVESCHDVFDFSLRLNADSCYPDDPDGANAPL